MVIGLLGIMWLIIKLILGIGLVTLIIPVTLFIILLIMRVMAGIIMRLFGVTSDVDK